MPLVSVILPTYNRADTILRAVVPPIHILVCRSYRSDFN
jgi:hypothetical protein